MYNVDEEIQKVLADTNQQLNDMQLEKLKKELKHSFENYQKTMKYMVADAPIEVLCLSKSLEKILLDNGLLRVYDLFDVDFVKIKGLGVSRIKELTTRIDEFFSML